MDTLGKVIDIYHDDDLKILINGSFWTYNPHAVTFCFNFTTPGQPLSDAVLDELSLIVADGDTPIDQLWLGVLREPVVIGL